MVSVLTESSLVLGRIGPRPGIGALEEFGSVTDPLGTIDLRHGRTVSRRGTVVECRSRKLRAKRQTAHGGKLYEARAVQVDLVLLVGVVFGNDQRVLAAENTEPFQYFTIRAVAGLVGRNNERREERVIGDQPTAVADRRGLRSSLIADTEVNAHLEPFVDLRIHIRTEVIARELRVGKDTGLIEVVAREEVGGLLRAARNRKVDLVHRGVLFEHLVEPVRIDARIDTALIHKEISGVKHIIRIIRV